MQELSSDGWLIAGANESMGDSRGSMAVIYPLLSCCVLGRDRRQRLGSRFGWEMEGGMAEVSSSYWGGAKHVQEAHQDHLFR